MLRGAWSTLELLHSRPAASRRCVALAKLRALDVICLIPLLSFLQDMMCLHSCQIRGISVAEAARRYVQHCRVCPSQLQNCLDKSQRLHWAGTGSFGIVHGHLATDVPFPTSEMKLGKGSFVIPYFLSYTLQGRVMCRELCFRTC